ncbi:hypothetical protein CVD25_19630 [Bacillus canaveralius]|uniref:Uncharacterized protein n=1 Tax=Bacillus canaveralius TaxID=1403243 RepID=A0A2N5GIQ5_9BACI|nr:MULTISPECIES: hypothetical protein [Bacillus]PLR80911.1 hypothetical protein CU635_16745 [Bacillus canaveralius]PLR83362.1 hypothetical protein CVD23_14265 [Bacillus sp. V33-4]PLR91199.1 hypothetical protein CVD25_19630 [Bacillus canaveralius]RSK52662.1 hypothetical protein EJA13_10410 [Bacillus canaveralius]
MLMVQAGLSILLLFAAFRFLSAQSRQRKPYGKAIFNLLFLLSSIPLMYLVYGDYIGGNLDAGMGVRTGFLLTWLVTGFVFIIGAIKYFRNRL